MGHSTLYAARGENIVLLLWLSYLSPSKLNKQSSQMRPGHCEVTADSFKPRSRTPGLNPCVHPVGHRQAAVHTLAPALRASSKRATWDQRLLRDTHLYPCQQPRGVDTSLCSGLMNWVFWWTENCDTHGDGRPWYRRGKEDSTGASSSLSLHRR